MQRQRVSKTPLSPDNPEIAKLRQEHDALEPILDTLLSAETTAQADVAKAKAELATTEADLAKENANQAQKKTDLATKNAILAKTEADKKAAELRLTALAAQTKELVETTKAALEKAQAQSNVLFEKQSKVDELADQVSQLTATGKVPQQSSAATVVAAGSVAAAPQVATGKGAAKPHCAVEPRPADCPSNHDENSAAE